MRRIVFLVMTDIFVPLFTQLAHYVERQGFLPSIVAFGPREHRWLKKNGVDVLPRDPYAFSRTVFRQGLFTTDELDSIIGFDFAKHGGDPEDWKGRALKIGTFLDDLLSQESFEAAVIWNGDEFTGKILSLLARRHEIKTVFAENGYFPNTLQFDLEGVNVNSSLTKLKMSEIADRLQDLSVDVQYPIFGLREIKPLERVDYLRLFIRRKLTPGYYHDFPEHRGGTWFTERLLKWRRSRVRWDRVDLPKKFIFIPFQVHDDTQILLNSPHFKSMESFFDFCHAAIRRTFGDDYAIVVKEHPEDLYRHSYESLYIRYPDVYWLKRFDIDELLNKASMVMVVNSSVGLQALTRFKPTVVFGNSFYTKEEIVFPVSDLTHAEDLMRAAGAGVSGEKRALIDTFLRFLKERYFVEGSWKNMNAESISKAGGRVLRELQSTVPAPFQSVRPCQ